MKLHKVLTIVGPTASGKTSLSIQLAQKFNGEIISADSRQVYRELNLGTGKITTEEMLGVPHHLLDVADPRDTYTVADFVRDGRTTVSDIISRNKLPIIVGGTFFYIDALLGKISTPEVEPNEELREQLELLNNTELLTLLKEKDPVRAETIDTENRRRLIRALEIIDTIGVVPEIQSEEIYSSLTIGIKISKEELKQNIYERLEKRLDAGMIEEVIDLHKNGIPHERLYELGIEYRYIAEYLQKRISKDEMCTLIETKSWQYAKRQMTWLKRDQSIRWFEVGDIEGIEEEVKEYLK